MQIRSWMPLARILRGLRFLRFMRGWDRVLRAFFDPDRQQPADLTFGFAGSVYQGSAANFVDWSAFFYGAYERQSLEFCLSKLTDPATSVMLDIGGNVGHHALWFAAQGCAVKTFEPNPALWGEIEKKMATAGLAGSIDLYRTGMGATDETREFFLPDGANQGTGSFENQPGNFAGERAELKISAGSDLLRAEGVGEADLIKIDVEGFEIEVMNGLKPFLARTRPIVWIEISADGPGRRIDMPMLKGFLSGAYRYYHAVPASPFLTSTKFIETDNIPEGVVIDIFAVPA